MPHQVHLQKFPDSCGSARRSRPGCSINLSNLALKAGVRSEEDLLPRLRAAFKCACGTSYTLNPNHPKACTLNPKP